MYLYKNTKLKKDQRATFNDKIFYLVNTNQIDGKLTKEQIFNYYTGNGGLHNLNKKDYNSYFDYAEEKKEIELGQFFTSPFVCQKIIELLKITDQDFVCDFAAGIGHFANYIKNKKNIFLNDIDFKNFSIAKYLYPEANHQNKDMIYFSLDQKVDFVVGNPPFNIYLENRKNSQFYFIEKALELLKPAGILAFIVPEKFLMDKENNKDFVEFLNKNFSFLGQTKLDKEAFENYEISINTKFMLFQKREEYTMNLDYDFLFNSWESLEYTYLLANQNRIENKHKILLDIQKEETISKEFLLKFNLYCYQISIHKKLKDHTAKAKEYLIKLKTQEKPAGMEFEEWQKTKLTENKVLSYLKRIIKGQHQKNKNKIKNDLTKYNYKKSIKIANQKMDFNYMQEDKKINDYLRSLNIYDSTKKEYINLNKIQKEDINKSLQKNYSYLQWSCGAGKTLAATTILNYRYNKIKKIFIVAPAIATKGTFQEFFERTKFNGNKFKYSILNKNSKFDELEKIILVTHDNLGKYKRQIKKLIKKTQSKNIFLIVDEADNFSCMDSQRTKNVLDIFRQAKYKLLMSGTSTRNTIQEFYPQLSLLYNHSQNMLDTCRTHFVFEKNKRGNIDKERIKEVENDNYLKPYKNYKKGFSEFKENFCPDKFTVFGVNKNTQNIYNEKELKKLLGYTIITRTFIEIAGKDITSIHQEAIEFTADEKNLYKKIMNEFHEFLKYFKTYENNKKNSMLKILHQLNTLIKAASLPHIFKEYEGTEVSTKIKKIIEKCNLYKNENIVIGARHIETVAEYAKYLSHLNRNIYIITGSQTIEQRKNIIDQLKNDKTGILICTQQSLSSSININFVDKIFIVELAWNNAVLEQFYMRFIRFDSERKKDLFYFTYSNSIESNILYMILRKESINKFMKNQEVTDILTILNVDFNLMDFVIEVEKDEEGNRKLKNKKIS